MHWGISRKNVLLIIARTFLISFSTVAFLYVLVVVFSLGYISGFKEGYLETASYYESIPNDRLTQEDEKTPIPTQIIVKETPSSREEKSLISTVGWGGPDLWAAVNAKRQEYGVNPLNQADELCTIASVRLNELLNLGRLDGHEGFSNLTDRRPDFEWIFEKYSVVAEFLLAGAKTADEAVSFWENTLAHKKLLTAGEYVWGCIYAQNSFAVAITAY